MKQKIVAPILATLVAIAGGYWHYSPYLALHGMQAAAEAKDADKLNTYVDYPKLRESLKGELAAKITQQMPRATDTGDQFEKAGAAFGAMLGLALVDKMVDAIVRPEVVMRTIDDARFETSPAVRGDAPASESHKRDVTWTLERKTNDLVVAYGADQAKPAERLGLVLERNGFANWKMTGIRLPDLN